MEGNFSAPTNDSNEEEKALISRIQSDTLRLNQIRTGRLYAAGSNTMANQAEDMAIRKQFLKAQDTILRNLLNTMETCKAQGFVYGLISKEGKVVTVSSESLQSWWQEKVRFHQTGPIVAGDYYSTRLAAVNASHDKPDINIREKLGDITGTILGSLLSALMQHCVPPQRQYPLDKGIPPHWWPTKKETWWTELGFPSDVGQPPYKKPHELRKIWKTAVLIAVLKNIWPDTARIRAIINQYWGLEGKMTAKELQAWSSVLEQMDREYLKENPNAAVGNAFHQAGLSNNQVNSSPCMMQQSLPAAFQNQGNINDAGYYFPEMICNNNNMDISSNFYSQPGSSSNVQFAEAISNDDALEEYLRLTLH